MPTDFCESCRKFDILKRSSDGYLYCKDCALTISLKPVSTPVNNIIPKKEPEIIRVRTNTLTQLRLPKEREIKTPKPKKDRPPTVDSLIEKLFKESPNEAFTSHEVIEYVLKENDKVDGNSVVIRLNAACRRGLIVSTFVKPDPAVYPETAKLLLYAVSESALWGSPKNKRAAHYVLDYLMTHNYGWSADICDKCRISRSVLIEVFREHTDKLTRCKKKKDKNLAYMYKEKHQLFVNDYPESRRLLDYENAKEIFQ